MEFNDLANEPSMKRLDSSELFDEWMKRIIDVGLIPEAIIRKLEKNINPFTN